MKKYSVLSSRKYNQNGEEKTAWYKIGTIIEMDNGSQFLSLNMWPDNKYVIKEDDGQYRNESPQINS